MDERFSVRLRGSVMWATPRNMQAVCDAHNEPIAVYGVVVYSHETGETFSSSPGDYFLMPPDKCLLDSEGNKMVLARKVVMTAYVDLDDPASRASGDPE